MPTVRDLCLEREKFLWPDSKNSKNSETSVNLIDHILICNLFLNLSHQKKSATEPANKDDIFRKTSNAVGSKFNTPFFC